uniref:GLTP domain-containing protein n=1 Tax=Macrostomum lignano TaxID=282301 RepID=A0A1I8F3W8_9PLAT
MLKPGGRERLAWARAKAGNGSPGLSTFDCRNLLCVMNDDQPMRGAPKYAARLLVGGRAAGARGQSLVVTPFHFSESTVKTPAALVLLMLALSVTFYRRFVGDPNVENDHPDGARKFLVLHKASRECLDKQAVETVCRTLEEMVSDSMKGLSSMEIWAYEVVHLQKLRELGYKLLEFLDDLKRDTRDSHNLAPTQVLTDVAMTLVLEREVRCLTNRDKEVPVHAFSAFSQSVADQQSMAQVPTRLTDVGPAGHPERHGLNYAAANTQLLSWARHIRKYQRAFLGEHHLEQSLAYPCGQVGHAVNHGQVIRHREAAGLDAVHAALRLTQSFLEKFRICIGNKLW